MCNDVNSNNSNTSTSTGAGMNKPLGNRNTRRTTIVTRIKSTSNDCNNTSVTGNAAITRALKITQFMLNQYIKGTYSSVLMLIHYHSIWEQLTEMCDQAIQQSKAVPRWRSVQEVQDHLNNCVYKWQVWTNPTLSYNIAIAHIIDLSWKQLLIPSGGLSNSISNSQLIYSALVDYMTVVKQEMNEIQINPNIIYAELIQCLITFLSPL